MLRDVSRRYQGLILRCCPCDYGRHSSVSKMAASTTFKIFISQLVNTALITLIVNAKYTGREIPLFTTLRILDGSYSDYNRDW
jgi:hypothetical protein